MRKEIETKEPPNPLSTLTALQRRYVEARVANMSQTQIAKHLDIFTSDCANFEKHPKIKLAIKYINDEALKGATITRRDVLAGMMDAVRTAATSTELVAAWREIGRIIGAYEPQKIAVTHEMLLPEQLRGMSDKQLMLMAGMDGEILEGEFEKVFSDS